MPLYFLFQAILQDPDYFRDFDDILKEELNEMIIIRYQNKFGKYKFVFWFDNNKIHYHSFLCVRCGTIPGFECNVPSCMYDPSGLDMNSQCRNHMCEGSYTYTLNNDGIILICTPAYYGDDNMINFDLWKYITNIMPKINNHTKYLLEYFDKKLHSPYIQEINKIILEYIG